VGTRLDRQEHGGPPAGDEKAMPALVARGLVEKRTSEPAYRVTDRGLKALGRTRGEISSVVTEPASQRRLLLPAPLTRLAPTSGSTLAKLSNTTDGSQP
jgi:hypothetical protein